MRRVALVGLVATLAIVGVEGDVAAELPKCRDPKSRSADFAMTDSGMLRACYAGKRNAACFVLDPGGTWTPIAVPRTARTADTEPEPEPIVANLTMGTTAKVCATGGKDCHTFVTPRAAVSKFIGPQVYANADRSVFAVALRDEVKLYDATGSLRVTIAAWPHPGDIVWSVSHVVISGYRVYVMMRDGMNAEVRAYDVRNGAPSTNIGAVDPVDPVDVGGNRVAFTMRHATSLDVYDQNAVRVRTVPLFSDDKNPATLLARSGDGKAIVVARWDDNTIAVVDTTAWTAAKIATPPVCP